MHGRATVCFWCRREMEAGAQPSRFGVCPFEDSFTVQYEAWIREHNAKLDAGDVAASNLVARIIREPAAEPAKAKVDR